MKAKNIWLTYLSLSKKPVGAVVFDGPPWTTKTLTDKESTTASGSGKSSMTHDQFEAEVTRDTNENDKAVR